MPTPSVSDTRAAASRVAKFLIAKNRADEAVALLSAWAAAGPNDPEGQGLLADALQLDPRSAVAKMAFERMEGMTGEHAELDQALAKYNPDEIARLEKELGRPVFRRAQLGFNNNLKYKGHVYHVQTEDSGLDKPHVITHLFADGGRVIKSFKRSYAAEVHRDDVGPYVKALMKGQHMEMLVLLRDGRFDPIIEGKQAGAMEVLTAPPNPDVARIGKKREPSSPQDAPPAEAPAPAGARVLEPAPVVVPPPRAAPAPKPTAPARVRYRLNVVRTLSDGPDVYEVTEDVAVVGTSGSIKLPGERFCHPREALFRLADGRLVLEDLEGGNGVFLRIRRPVELAVGDEFILGDQLLRIDKVPQFDHTPGPGPTYCYSSPMREASYRVVQIFEGGREGGCVLARGTTVYIGAGYNDMIIRGDPLVSEYHCLLDEQAGAIILTDLGSRTGVFVRVQGQQELHHGDELLIGRTRLELELPAA
jgi:pSer/pThr/pTyr-binding forkhead associated (FHA) protein